MCLVEFKNSIYRSALRLTANLLNSYASSKQIDSDIVKLTQFLKFYIPYSFKLDFENGKERYIRDEIGVDCVESNFWKGRLALNLIMKAGEEEGPMFCKAFFNPQSRHCLDLNCKGVMELQTEVQDWPWAVKEMSWEADSVYSFEGVLLNQILLNIK